MKSTMSFSKITNVLGSFFQRFHTIIFFMIVSTGLFVAILMLLSVISLSSSTTSSYKQSINGSFDEATIQRIEQRSSGESAAGDRLSPFVE